MRMSAAALVVLRLHWDANGETCNLFPVCQQFAQRRAAFAIHRRRRAWRRERACALFLCRAQPLGGRCEGTHTVQQCAAQSSGGRAAGERRTHLARPRRRRQPSPNFEPELSQQRRRHSRRRTQRQPARALANFPARAINLRPASKARSARRPRGRARARPASAGGLH